MTGPEPTLKELLSRLQKASGLGPPTREEAEAAMEGPEEAPLDDARLLEIAGAVVRGKPIARTDKPATVWCEDHELIEADVEEFAGAFRNGGDIDEETRKRIEEAEQKALSDDDEDDDEDGVDGVGNTS